MVKIGIIGGSGLDDPKILEDYEEKEVETIYGKPSSKLICGKISGVDCVFISRHGKTHSIMPTKVPYKANIEALRLEGCTHIIATTACGSLKEEIKPKDFIFIDQFIDFTKHRALTFHEDKVIHTPMAEPFCPALREIFIETAKEIGLKYHTKGVMVTIEGPRFSTKAESFMFQKLGAEVINMSSVPEVSLARESGMCYASIAMATDYDCWRDGEESVTWELVKERMKENSENVKKLILKVIPKIKEHKCG
jgi:5'-methylthioadenosine phosphorylase